MNKSINSGVLVTPGCRNMDRPRTGRCSRQRPTCL